MTSRIDHYDCTVPTKEWTREGQYSIAKDKSKYIILIHTESTNCAWDNFKSQTEAYQHLVDSFESVKPHNIA